MLEAGAPVLALLMDELMRFKAKGLMGVGHCLGKVIKRRLDLNHRGLQGEWILPRSMAEASE